jgi:hypothetical protein
LIETGIPLTFLYDVYHSVGKFSLDKPFQLINEEEIQHENTTILQLLIDRWVPMLLSNGSCHHKNGQTHGRHLTAEHGVSDIVVLHRKGRKDRRVGGRPGER